jgi:hypothetical protein
MSKIPSSFLPLPSHPAATKAAASQFLVPHLKNSRSPFLGQSTLTLAASHGERAARIKLSSGSILPSQWPPGISAGLLTARPMSLERLPGALPAVAARRLALINAAARGAKKRARPAKGHPGAISLSPFTIRLSFSPWLTR